LLFIRYPSDVKRTLANETEMRYGQRRVAKR
jgi:hypothetical protein